jgi:hypothetical protein
VRKIFLFRPTVVLLTEIESMYCSILLVKIYNSYSIVREHANGEIFEIFFHFSL